MKTKTIVKELNLLDIEDIEEAVSAYLGRKVSISEIYCRLVHCIPADTMEPEGAYLEFDIGHDVCYSWEVFDDEEWGEHYWHGKKLALSEPWITEEDIFNFDVSAFRTFTSGVVDSSD